MAKIAMEAGQRQSDSPIYKTWIPKTDFFRSVQKSAIN